MKKSHDIPLTIGNQKYCIGRITDYSASHDVIERNKRRYPDYNNNCISHHGKTMILGLNLILKLTFLIKFMTMSTCSNFMMDKMMIYFQSGEGGIQHRSTMSQFPIFCTKFIHNKC